MSEEWQNLGIAATAALARTDYLAASQALAAAVALRPDHADSWFNLGYSRRQLGDYEGALCAYASALANGIEGAEAAHVNRAIILSNHLGKMAEAETELQMALALDAGYLPAWLNLGELFEDRGDAVAAREAYGRALKVAPQNGRAQARLTALAILDGDIEQAIDTIEARCLAGLTQDDDALDILFAYGNALDAAARYDDAFEAVTAANALSARLRHPAQRYVPAQMEQLVDQLCAFKPAETPKRGTGDESRALFICGMFRSGSTVFEQLLTRHPQVVGGGEFEMIPAFVHGQLRPYPDRLSEIDESEVGAMRQSYSQMLDSVSPDCRFVTDKRPDNFLHIGLIKRLFPDAKILVTRRGTLDNLLSIFFLNFAESINYSDQLAHIAHYMGQYDRLMAHWTSLYREDIHFVDYEALVADPDPVLESIYSWLGLADSQSGAATAAPIIRTPSNWQARAALHHNSVGRWLRYQQPLAAHHKLLASLPNSGWRKS